MKKRFLPFMLLAILLTITLTACQPERGRADFVTIGNDTFPINPRAALENASEKVHVEWIEINPPPGFDGPCYVFFESFGSGLKLGYGYSSTVCE